MAPNVWGLVAEGDRNTKYFHQKAQWRARKNKIKRLKNGHGQWCENQAEMAQLASDFFLELYTKDDIVFPDTVIRLFEEKVTDDMNDLLCRT